MRLSTEETPVRVGVVGTGFGARTHIPVFQATPGICVSAVAGANKERAEKVAQKYNISHAFNDYRQLVELPEINLVSVVTPPNLHYPVVMAALEAGKHVLCEKPMAMDANESRVMLDKAREKGIIHLMNFEFRTVPVRKKMKLLIDEGYLGQLYLVHVSIFTNFWRDYSHIMRRWWFRSESGGGWLGALGFHFIDALLCWFGEMVEVSAQLDTLVTSLKVKDFEVPQNVDADDTFSLLVRFKNGASGVFASSAVAHTTEMPRVVAYGSEGTLVLEGDCLYGSRRGETEMKEITVGDDESVQTENIILDPHYVPFTRWVQHIAEAIPCGQQVSPSFEDGLRCQVVMDAARLSSTEGKRVIIIN
ncbi:MAG: Gfo/Idh/MocA family oxidoreductase [Dehalococcoidia bacterium]|nr:MAG: Gfo/Idh/MocA family oxidoreductase [Dehalococcoidia bacterium]